MDNFNNYQSGRYYSDYDYQLYMARANEKKQLSKKCVALGVLLLLYEFLQYFTGYVFDVLFVLCCGGGLQLSMGGIREFFYNNPQYNSTTVNMAYSVAVVAGSFIILMIFAGAVFKINLKSIFRPDKQHPKTIVACFPAIMLLNLAISYIIAFISFYMSENGIYIPEADFSFSDASMSAFFFQILYGVIIAPIVEEAMYRGFVIHLLKPYGKGMAVIISSLIFGLMHGNIAQAANGFCFALVMGTITVYSNSIIPTIGIHMLNNALAQIPDIADILGSEALYQVYYALVIACLVLGVLAIFANHKKIKLPKDDGCVLTRRERYRAVLLSPPVVVYWCYLAFVYISSFVAWNS